MSVAYICEGFRTPIGRYGGALAQIRTDDLAAVPLAALREKFVRSDWESLDEIVLGCTNQAGEDNRNVARMALLLAGIPHTVPAMTVNRLCGSGMEAIAVAARAIAAGEISLAIAGGAESMSRAPMVIPKAYSAFSRNAEIYDTTLRAIFVASEAAASRFGLTPMARVIGTAAAGVPPDVMGIGPIPAIQKLLGRFNLKMEDMDVVEVNEAFAAQALAVIRAFSLPDDCEKVNPNGGAIALGHPLGMSGARLVLTAARQLQRVKGRYALASMCIGVGQGIATLLAQP